MSEHPSSAKRTGKESPRAPQVAAMAILLLSIFIDCSLAIQVFSGETYSFAAQTPPHGSIYAYEWSAADGYPTKNTDRVFSWTAPNVDVPRDIAVNITITDRGCWATNETVVTVIPKLIGQIRLEVSQEGEGKDVLLGDTISYTISITNIGQTDVISLPLVDCYPIESLKPLSSIPPWKEDNGSALIWNNLLDKPLARGESLKVLASFRAIATTSRTVTNLVRVEGARDDKDAKLKPQEAGSIIAAIQSECPKLGPDTACAGEGDHPFDGTGTGKALPVYRDYGAGTSSGVVRVTGDHASSCGRAARSRRLNLRAPGLHRVETALNAVLTACVQPRILRFIQRPLIRPRAIATAPNW